MLSMCTSSNARAVFILLSLTIGVGAAGCDKSDSGETEKASAESAEKTGDESADKGAASAAESGESEGPTLPDPKTVDKKGAAYFSVANVGLVQLSADGEFSKVGKKLKMATDMHATADGTVYLATVSGVYSAKDGELKQFGDYKSVGNVKRVAASEDGTVWGTSFKGVHKWDGKSWSTTEKAKFGKDVKLFKDIAAGPDGQVVVASSNKLHALKDGEWSVQDTSAIDAKPFFKEIEFGPNGTLFATGNHGLAARMGEKWSIVDLQDDYASASYLSVGADGTAHAAKLTGDVWAVAGSDVRAMSTKDKLGATNIHAVAGDGQGRTWLGTNNGVVIWKADGSTIQWKPGTVEELSGKVEAVAVTKGGPALPKIGPQKKGSVTGKVLKDGSPLAGVQVQACESPATMFRKSPCESKPVKFSGKTDDSGVFKFDNVPVGTYGFAIKPSADKKWRVTLAFDCCSKLQDGKTYDVGSFDLSR